MAYITNDKIRLRVRLYQLIENKLRPISAPDIIDSEPAEYTIDEVSLIEKGGVGSITHQLEKDGAVVNTGNVNIVLDNSIDQHGTWIGASGVFQYINNESIFYDCQILVEKELVNLESEATDGMPVLQSVRLRSGTFPEDSTIEPVREEPITYQILYGGYIDQSTWLVDNWNKTVSFTIRSYTTYMKAFEFPGSFRSYEPISTILQLVSGRQALRDDTEGDNILIKENVITNKFLPIVTNYGILSILGSGHNVYGLYPYDTTNEEKKYCLQVGTRTGITTYLGSPLIGWTELTGYTADYRNGIPIQPTNSGFYDLKTATTGWGASFSGGNVECPYNLDGIMATDIGIPPLTNYNILRSGVRWATWDTYGDLPYIGCKCPIIARASTNGQTRFIYTIWDGVKYTDDPTGFNDLAVDVQGAFFDVSSDTPGFIVFDDIDGVTRNQAAFFDTNIYTYNATDNASFPEKFKVIHISPREITDTGTNNQYYVIVEIEKKNETRWQTLLMEAEILTPPGSFSITHFTHVNFTTVSSYSRFSPISNWDGTNSYKATIFKYKGELCWGLTYSKNEDGYTNVYYEIRDFNGNQKNISLLMGNVSGNLVTCIDARNTVRETWRLVYAGYCDDLNQFITGELRVMDTSEQLDTNYRNPYIYRSDKDYATILTNLARSYGYVWWIRPDKVLQWTPRESVNDSVRDDLGELILANSAWEGGYWTERYSQIDYKYGISEKFKMGSGVSVSINMPYLQSKDIAVAIAGGYYSFFGLRRWGNVDLDLYYTQLLNGVQIEIEWMLWKLNIQIGENSMQSNLELLEAIPASTFSSSLLNCMLGTLTTNQYGSPDFMNEVIYYSCPVCGSCEIELNAVISIWREIITESRLTFAERYSIIDIIYEQLPRWESQMRNLLTCINTFCISS